MSRDLRELGVAKMGDRYVLPETGAAPKSDFSALKQFVNARMTAGTNLTVLKTTVGSAQSVAVAIDTARWPEVVGTISGDDTIFIATAGAREQRELGVACSPFSDAKPYDIDFTAGAEPILLAFSGGLDTSFCVPWLKDTYQRPVITVTVDTGGIDAAAAQSLAERSAQLGAVEHHLIDARTAYFEQVLKFLIMGNVRRGGVYPLCVGAERVLQAQTIAQMALSLEDQDGGARLHRGRQ